MTQSLRASLAVLLLAGGAAAQALSNGGFECPQIAGTAVAAPWNEVSGSDSGIVTAATVPAGTASGFPTEGTQFLRLSTLGTGPFTGTCTTAPANGSGGAPQTAGRVTQTFMVTAATLSFQWTFLLGESPNDPVYNDFFRADLWNPAVSPPAFLANVVYVDGGLAACPIVGAPAPLTFTNASGLFQVNPPGPKTATFNVASLPGIGIGSQLMISFAAGNRGDDAGTSYAYVDNVLPNSTAPQGQGQPNSSLAGLAINGTGLNTTCAGPYYATVAPGGTVTLSVSGPVLQPYALFAGPLNVANLLTPFGKVDIGTPPGYGNLTVVMNGFGGTTLLDMLAVLNGAGASTVSFPLPNAAPFLPGFEIGNFQALVGQTGAPPFRLTGAVKLTVQ